MGSGRSGTVLQLKINKLEGHTEGVNSVNVSSDGNYIVSGSWDKKILIWDFKSGNKL